MGTNYYWNETPDCPHCHRAGERKHIGKSSAGWVFALHVYPDEGINDIDDWAERFWKSPKITDEYGATVTPGEMLAVIMIRGRENGQYPKDFDWQANGAMRGPNGLIRAQTGQAYRTIRHGAGTWDCHEGDFS